MSEEGIKLKCIKNSVDLTPRYITQTETWSRWRICHHWLCRKLSTWQLPVQPMITNTWWPFRNSNYVLVQRNRCQERRVFRSLSKLLNAIEVSTALTHWDRDKMADISQTTFSNAFSWMKMNEFRLRYHWNLFLRVQLTISQHCFR